jgi:uncharacterized membrane protein
MRTTLVGGLVFLVPLVVLAVVAGKALALARKVVEPLAAWLPVESVLGLRAPLLLAGGVIVIICFLAGFLARTVLARRVVRKLETAVLSSVPGYEFLKHMSESMLGLEREGAYPVVLVRFDDSSQIGFQIEVLEDGCVVVFVPGVPNANAGDVYVMNADRIVPLNVPSARMMKCLQRLGVGSAELLRGGRSRPGLAVDAVSVSGPGSDRP